MVKSNFKQIDLLRQRRDSNYFLVEPNFINKKKYIKKGIFSGSIIILITLILGIPFIFRTKFLDFCWGGRSYFVGDPSNTDLRQLFKNHIGLRIELTNRNMKNISTRRKFMVNQLDNIEGRILKQMNN